MKTCFKCGEEKELSEFYAHKQMADGHLNKCKVCAKRDVAEHRQENLEKIKAYDKERSKLDHRVQARKDYQKTDAGKRARSVAAINHREKFPEKYKARCALGNAIRDGKIVRPENCEVCGVECVTHGHHESYDEDHRLDVIWVCVNCHVDIHNERRALASNKN